MPPTSRPAAAAIAAAIIGGRRYATTFDYAAGIWRSLTAEVRSGRVQAFDHGRSARIEGVLPSQVRDFHDHSIYRFETIAPRKVLGYHSGGRTFFEARVEDAGAPNELIVHLHDFETGERGKYLVK